jgi:hypothetical protein
MKAQLANNAITELSKQVDPILASQLLTEAEEQEIAFTLHKWKYTQLDGGRFCEVAARILYAADFGTANLTKSVELDSRLIIESCRWVLADILRLFAASSSAEIAELIQELAFRPTLLVRQYGDKKLLQSVSFKTEEEILALLHFGPKEGMQLSELVRYTPKDPSGVRRSVKTLVSSKKREAIVVKNLIMITDLGINRIEDIIRTKVTG